MTGERRRTDRDGPEDEVRRFLKAQEDPPKRGPLLRVVRRLAREVVAFFVVLSSVGHRLGRTLLQTEYVVTGACKKRGACCHHILLEWSPWLDRHPRIARLMLWKLTRFYSFYDKGYAWEIQDGLIARVLGCHALLPDGRCGEYRLRPSICRTYPEVPFEGPGLLLKGCGYGFGRRHGSDVSPLGGHDHHDVDHDVGQVLNGLEDGAVSGGGRDRAGALAGEQGLEGGMLVQITRRGLGDGRRSK